MSATTQLRTGSALMRAALSAVRAPSVHNTQPWAFIQAGTQLTMNIDRERQLKVLDPSGRQLMISCGCALFNARVSAASDGFHALVERFPDDADSDTFARVTLSPRNDGEAVAEIAALDAAIFTRRTNRRPFYSDPIPPNVIDALMRDATGEGALLIEVRSADDRRIVAELSQRADEVQSANRAYRAELRKWITADASRPDGVAVETVPLVDGLVDDEIPIRDFDTNGLGRLPANTHSNAQQCLLLLGTYSDAPESWLRAGEALERILLEITRLGLAVSPLTQIVEVPATREALRSELGLAMYPHVLLRVGHATATPATRRRPLSDVLVDEQV